MTRIPKLAPVINIKDRPRKRPTKADYKNYQKPPNDSA